MKKETRNRIRLGIFVAAGILLFMAGIYYIGMRRQLFNETFRISAIFKNVNGLQVGNNVQFSGITVGIVEDVEIISDTLVRVDMTINQDIQKFIKQDAKAIIGSEGLMGNKLMNITPGTSSREPVKHNSFIGTAQVVSIDDILAKVKLTAENTSKISSDLLVITNNIRAGKGTIGKLFMDTVFAMNLDRTIATANKAAEGFGQNMKAAQNSFLLRGYFKKKKDRKEKEKEENEKKEEQEKKKK